jgi:hypothetical protein
MKPSRVTFTGIDPGCSRAELYALLAVDPRIELGILYSESKAGSTLDLRYPPFEWIRDTAAAIEMAYGFGRVALHVCGRAVRNLIQGNGLEVSTWPYERMQLNGKFNDVEAGQIRRFIGEGTAYSCITQFDANPVLHEICRRQAHQVLFDASGGRGILRKEWPKALPDHACGYAGGLGPDNLRTELPRIAAVAGPKYWVDMEGSLRDEADHFCIGKARLALDTILEAEVPQSDGSGDANG